MWYQIVLQMTPNSSRPYVGEVNSAFRFSKPSQLQKLGLSQNSMRTMEDIFGKKKNWTLYLGSRVIQQLGPATGRYSDWGRNVSNTNYIFSVPSYFYNVHSTSPPPPPPSPQIKNTEQQCYQILLWPAILHVPYQ